MRFSYGYILKMIPTAAPIRINTSGCTFLNTEKPANTDANSKSASIRTEETENTSDGMNIAA